MSRVAETLDIRHLLIVLAFAYSWE